MCRFVSRCLHIKSAARARSWHHFESYPTSSEMENLASPVSYHTGPNAILLPVFAALSIAIVYVPFVLLLRVKKVAACTMVIVVAVVNFLTFINAILWPNDNIAAWFTGVGVCDIEVQIRTPMSTLLATSMAYLTKDLAMAMDTDNPRLVESRAQRRRRLWVELTFCFAIPILQMALYYIVQANRFAIVTVYGCVDSVDSSWPTVVIRAIWPPLFALLNCYYASKSTEAYPLAPFINFDSSRDLPSVQAPRYAF